MNWASAEASNPSRIWTNLFMEISTHQRFDKHYKKLPETVKEKAKAKEKIFRRFPFDPSLRTHKLHGKDRGAWAFWIDFHYRIKFMFVTENAALFLDIGLHDIYE